MSESRDFGYGYCPVQIEGSTSNGLPYYFRARGRDWHLYIAKEANADPLDNYPFMCGNVNSAFKAGWMPHELAKALTEWAVACYEADLDKITPTRGTPNE